MNPTAAGNDQSVDVEFDRSGDSPLATALRRLAEQPQASGSRVGFNSFVGGE